MRKKIVLTLICILGVLIFILGTIKTNNKINRTFSIENKKGVFNYKTGKKLKYESNVSENENKSNQDLDKNKENSESIEYTNEENSTQIENYNIIENNTNLIIAISFIIIGLILSIVLVLLVYILYISPKK